MVLCAALKIEIKDKQKDSDRRFLILPCLRHGNGLAFVREYMQMNDQWHIRVFEEGFILTNGTFLNRRDALQHAIDCGQLSQSTRWYKEDHGEKELYSEDLY